MNLISDRTKCAHLYEKGTYYKAYQRWFMRDWASAQSGQNVRCSWIQNMVKDILSGQKWILSRAFLLLSAERRSWSGPKPFDIRIVFLKEFFEKVYLKKKIQQTAT